MSITLKQNLVIADEKSLASQTHLLFILGYICDITSSIIFLSLEESAYTENAVIFEDLSLIDSSIFLSISSIIIGIKL